MVMKVTLASEIADALPPRSCLLLGTAEPVRILRFVPLLVPPEGTSKSAWTVEHARTVRAMCPGGVTVIGIYAGRTVDTDASSRQSMATLARRAISDDRSVSHAIVLATSGSGRVIVRTISIHDATDDGSKSADVRTTSVFPLFELKGYIKLDGIPLTISGTSQRQLEVAAVDHINKLVDEAAISFPGDRQTEIITNKADTRPFSEMSGAASTIGKKKGKSKGLRSATKRKGSSNLKGQVTEQISVHVHLPLGPSSPDGDTDSETEHDGSHSVTDELERSLRVTGGVYILAVVPAEATAGEALRAVREDITRSLHTRVNLMHETTDDSDDGKLNEEKGKDTEITENDASLERHWPTRVIARAAPGDHARQLGMTEYVAKGEALEEVEERVTEVLSWTSDDVASAPIELVERGNDVSELVAKPQGQSAETVETRTVDRVADGATEEKVEGIHLEDEQVFEGEHPQWMVNLLLATVVIVILAILLRQVI